MDSGILAWIIPISAIIGGAVGWFSRQYWQYRATKREAALDAGQILKEKKVLIEEMIAGIDDYNHKEELRLQLDEVNTALLGLHSERLRRTLKDAGLPPEEALIADGLSQLQPQQVAQLNKEIAEVKSLPTSDSISDLLALGNSYYYAGQYDDAKDIYDRILELDNNNYIILNNRGVTYRKLERYDEALADFNHSLELSPDQPHTLNNRGLTYDTLERYDEALADYNHSLELSPDDPVIIYNRGITYDTLERYDEALTDYNHSLEIRPDHPDTLNNRGIIYGKLERYDEALTDFNRSLERRPDHPTTLYNRGITYVKLERYDEALADHNRALEIKPDYASPLYNLACLFSLQGNVDEAFSYLEKAISKDKKYKEMAKKDKDFDNIRDDPRFKKLIEEE